MGGRRIDVHNHYFGEVVFRFFAKMGLLPEKFPIRQWTPEEAIAFMDRHDIATQILSLPFALKANPADPTFPVPLIREINETYADLIRDYPGRFGAFASLPFNTADAALAEIDYALDVLKLDGVVLTSNIGGEYFGQPFLEPILAELSLRQVPVFVHPTDCPRVSELSLGRSGSIVEFPMDTARNISNAMFTGVFLRHPGLQLILAHGGGVLPTLGWRIAAHVGLGQAPGDADISSTHVSDVLRNLYYEIALAASPHSLLPTLQVTDHDHLLFGTDYDAAPEPVIASNIENLTASGILDDAELRAIERGNAERLFPRLTQL
ncbi:hydrolase [Mycolicibacterium fortuitum]|uniref:amidohydrolase family protein n=1 Tax=Mycolicibacterium fortuitum TaxID=1766 RepID=UPI0007ED6414|nr:amidohydrolase family protein [Mycolicibacterium fortuitum]OBJ95445.1 hydrolase [Mycolicibacterium fortuitum]